MRCRRRKSLGLLRKTAFPLHQWIDSPFKQAKFGAAFFPQEDVIVAETETNSGTGWGTSTTGCHWCSVRLDGAVASSLVLPQSSTLGQLGAEILERLETSRMLEKIVENVNSPYLSRFKTFAKAVFIPFWWKHKNVFPTFSIISCKNLGKYHIFDALNAFWLAVIKIPKVSTFPWPKIELKAKERARTAAIERISPKKCKNFVEWKLWSLE